MKVVALWSQTDLVFEAGHVILGKFPNLSCFTSFIVKDRFVRLDNKIIYNKIALYRGT